MPLADHLEPEPIRELRETNERLLRRLAAEKQRTAELVEAVYRAARDAALSMPLAKVAAPRRGRRAAREEVALVHATDWQVGKRTATYNVDVAQERLGLLGAKVAKLAEIQRADHPIRRCVLLLGGDMVEGVTIFPGQAWEVDATLYEQLFRTVSIVEDLCRCLLGAFEAVEVWDIHGNHGRIGRRGDVPGLDNLDRVVYRIAAERLTGQSRLSWHHSENWYQIVPIGEYRALLVHGDQIRSFGGNLPAYGILRKVNAWAAGVVEPFSDAYLGHFHSPQTLLGANGRRVFMTGSPESGNEFAREFVAASGLPSQRLNMIDPAVGRVTSEHLIWLDGA